MAHEPDIPPLSARLLALAEHRPQRAVALAKQALHAPPKDRLGLAWAHCTYGWALLAWERADAAREPLHVGQREFERIGLAYGALRCRYALLLADQLQLARARLEDEFAGLAAEFATLGAASSAARVAIDHARHLNVLGRPRDAETLLDAVAPELAYATPIDRARHARIRGNAANARGDFARAAVLLAQAERVFTIQAYPIDAAKCQLDRAWLALRQEQLGPAQAGYLRAERAFVAHDLPLQRAACAKNLGLLYAKRGEYDRALQCSLAALADFTALRRTADIGACHLHLGNIYFYIGAWEAALACYGRAEAIYATLGMDGYSLVAQRNRAMVYRMQGRRAETFTLLAAIEARARELDILLELAEACAIQGALLAEQAEWGRATACFRQARAIFVQHQNLHGVAECELELGWVALAQADTAAALASFAAAAPATRQHPHDHWRVEYGLARCAELRGDTSAALGHYRAASATVASLRRQLAGAAISSSLFTQAARMHDDGLRLATGQNQQTAALELSERQRALILQHAIHTRSAAPPAPVQTQLDAQRAQLAQALLDPANPALIDAALAAYSAALLTSRHAHQAANRAQLPEQRFDLALLRAGLCADYGRDWTALIYIVNDQTLWIADLTADALEFSSTALDAELHALIEQASHQRYRSYTFHDFAYLQGAAARPWQRLGRLAERLLPAPVRARLHAQHRLLIVPAGPLHMLPWPALRLTHGWLVEQALLQIVPSLAIGQALAAHAPNSATQVLFVGCHSFGGRAPPLPGVNREQAIVARAWPATTTLRDEQASLAALLERSRQGQLRGYGVIHIASHAQLAPARGVVAHLKLADGDMSLADLAELDLDRCLVVLSACDGAAADVLPGEELLSLSWALLAAGARAVLASLWPVDDQTVVAIIEQFYAALCRHNDVAQALAEAQRAMLDAGPASWGSFVVIGG